MDRAIITINYHDYYVTDAKKALTVIQILNSAQRVHALGYNEYELSDEAVDVSMTVLSAKVKVLPRKVKTPKK